ncbi:protein farnesyltransferase/geranylgeranyltransferase type-1 subunit alpha [Stomoxys calcitrans]|uniref:Protein farnesyltransferase/geranylgeranyltransferase type-1 subunit alpha n=1 Tax=Stomoxys calcitrans TaxID=35570 RepID=A0A1I8NS22_STOCA|nr:protein farnesyltransferase/geranylgeranyltransferase type-1 subunit alpha [Stomoxys calcitrans]XP_013104249.1 protein farnesyltransferase/geranylgeranyltransferase type-1 subunit alpha [Stomoxys calcitrans]
MSDTSDEEWSESWIPYSQRSDWKDVVPLAQDDGENPVVEIAYSAKFREIFDYFRAILARQEKSSRALELTTDALRLNPANYTVWQYRRDILRELGSDLSEELGYIEDVITENAKNYQVWHHRRVIVEMLNDASKELDLTEMALRTDAKNYHAWQHRQWAISTFNLYDDELAFVDRLISEDIRNNSAWNQRFFVLKHFGFTTEVIQRELDYALNRIRIVKNNESSWNYLKGILRRSGNGSLSQFPEVIAFCEELYANNSRSPYLIAFLIDVYCEKCLQTSDLGEKEALSRKVYSLCDDMSKKHDVIRRKYWQYVADQLKSKLDSKQL